MSSSEKNEKMVTIYGHTIMKMDADGRESVEGAQKVP